ncbi:hypothetical protein DFQ27_005329 [Actinomortierella ambigua]|uniref:Uncharacterized protein n=1 Tax=Actinomortierella ambigua TaxID=1343610 RepID=A0A9P6QHP8_9FUNG|nr:hypothetical protein DFQ27_005329 [Actinomortierella ambigua]
MSAPDGADQQPALKHSVEETAVNLENKSESIAPLPEDAPVVGSASSASTRDDVESPHEPRTNIERMVPKVSGHPPTGASQVSSSSTPSRNKGRTFRGATATTSSSSTTHPPHDPLRSASTLDTRSGQVEIDSIVEQFTHIYATLEGLRTAVNRLEHTLKEARILDTGTHPAALAYKNISHASQKHTLDPEPPSTTPATVPQRLSFHYARGARGRQAATSASASASSGRPGFRKFGARGPSWTPKVIENKNVRAIQDFNDCKLSRQVLQLEFDYVDQMVLRPLVDGTDIVLQVRGQKLRDYVGFTLVDAMAEASPESYAVVLVNSLSSQSTRILTTTLTKFLRDAELSVDIKRFSDDLAETVTANSQREEGKPAVFICTADLFAQLAQEGVLSCSHHVLLVMYEAEYILGRWSVVLPKIQNGIKAAEPGQMVVAVMHGSTAVYDLPGKLNFRDDGVIYSADYDILHRVRHFFFEDDNVMEMVLNRVVEIGDSNLAVVICSDQNAVQQVQDLIKERVKVYSPGDADISAGVLLTTNHAPSTGFRDRLNGCVLIIVDLSGNGVIGERYVNMTSSYVAVGEDCDVVLKVGSADSIRSMESLLGITVTKIEPGQNPFIAS